MRRESRNQVEAQGSLDNRNTLTEAGADINLGSESGLCPSWSTRWSPLALAVVLLFLGLPMFLPTAALAADSSFVVPVTIPKDSPSDFQANGPLTSIDKDDPPNGIDAGSSVIDGPNWRFVIWNRVKDWRYDSNSDNGADDLSVSIAGMHKHGPHPPPATPYDIDPNALPVKKSTEQQAVFGRAVMLAAYNNKKHWTQPTGFHWDQYGIKHMATPMKGPPHLVTGPMQVAAKHNTDYENEETLIYGTTIGSSMDSGTAVAYDAASGRLSFSLGATDIVNASGSLVAGVDSTYQGDPVVGAPLVLPDLYYQGVDDSTGQYIFTGGGIELFGPNQERRFQGAFAEYRISSTTDSDTLKSFALLDSLTILDAGDCPSAFLRDFVAVHIIGDAIPREEWLALVGIGFTFVTPIELWQVTQGFTQSMSGMQATVAVCGNASVGSPSGVASPDAGDGAVHLVAVAPNPFRTGADIRYELPSASPVRIDVFNVAGQRVRTLVDLVSQPAGQHSVVWDGTDERGKKASPGVYFSRLSTGSITQRARMVLVR